MLDMGRLVTELAVKWDVASAVAVAPALPRSLPGSLVGAAAGLPLRRVLPAMVVTFGVLLVLKAAWSFLRSSGAVGFDGAVFRRR